MEEKMAAKMAEKMKACQNKSTNISTDDEFQNIFVKNPEKDIDFVQEWRLKSVKSNHEMEADLQTLNTGFADFKKSVLDSIY